MAKDSGDSPLDPKQLDSLQNTTLNDYSSKANSFWQRTKDHDVTQNYEALLSQFETGRSLDVLDFGCGPGRDLYYFKQLGHRPVGLDGSAEFCQMATEYSGCETLHQQFLALDLPPNRFDGIFANASLFHVPMQCMALVLSQLHVTLQQNGVLFMSLPRGDVEGWRGDRYGNFMEFEVIEPLLSEAGFDIVSHYYRPDGLPKVEQSWLAIVCRKLSEA